MVIYIRVGIACCGLEESYVDRVLVAHSPQCFHVVDVFLEIVTAADPRLALVGVRLHCRSEWSCMTGWRSVRSGLARIPPALPALSAILCNTAADRRGAADCAWQRGVRSSAGGCNKPTVVSQWGIIVRVTATRPTQLNPATNARSPAYTLRTRSKEGLCSLRSLHLL